MAFGFGGAVVAGFLGAPLAGLVALWLLGRIAGLFSRSEPALVAAAFDLVFPAVFIFVVARSLPGAATPLSQLDDRFLAGMAHELEHRFRIRHATIQIETRDGECRLAPAHVV
ncbi:hypothetical protein WOC76_00645 [Methylocystis sp. IM3]|uniref:hypothetical protein n=1 Tax=unclassified Methylocystis TaxID=2625913 RepID=UPI0030F555B1